MVACKDRDENRLESRKTLEAPTEPAEPAPTSQPNPNVAPVDIDPASLRIELETERAKLSRDIEARTKQVDLKIDEIERSGHADRAAVLRAKRDEAHAKLNELGNTTHETWQSFKKDVIDAWDQLAREVANAAEGR